MEEKSKIINWINNILDENAKLEEDKGSAILEICGKNCCKNDYLHRGALEVKKALPNATVDELFNTYKKNHYDTDRLIKKDHTIELIFEACSCPIVKMGVNNPNMCQCTMGYSKMIFETLFGKEVKVNLKASILKGDKHCKQIIEI